MKYWVRITTEHQETFDLEFDRGQWRCRRPLLTVSEGESRLGGGDLNVRSPRGVFTLLRLCDFPETPRVGHRGFGVLNDASNYLSAGPIRWQVTARLISGQLGHAGRPARLTDRLQLRRARTTQLRPVQA